MSIIQSLSHFLGAYRFVPVISHRDNNEYDSRVTLSQVMKSNERRPTLPWDLSEMYERYIPWPYRSSKISEGCTNAI